MLKEGTIPIVDQPLIQAVKYALDQLGVNPDTLPKKKRRTCLDGVGYGGESSYNGHFTIKLRTLEDGTQKIVVCDGATYDAEKGTSADSVAFVNSIHLKVPYFETDIIGTDKYIVGEFVPDLWENAGSSYLDNVYVKIVLCDNIYAYENATEEPKDGLKERYISLIGEYHVRDGACRIIQRHTLGVLDIKYHIRCMDMQKWEWGRG